MLIVYFRQQHRSLFQEQLFCLLREHRVVLLSGSVEKRKKGRAKQRRTRYVTAGWHLCDVNLEPKAFLDAGPVRQHAARASSEFAAHH